MIHPGWLPEVDDEAGEVDAEYSLRWLALAVVCLAVFIAQVDMTVMNVALPSIAVDLNAQTADLQWVMDSYSITLAGFVLLGGGLADHYGRKGVFMAGLALFGVASLVAASSNSIGQLIAARSFMGLGAALTFPPALSLIAVMFTPEYRSKAVSVWAMVGGTATAIGPIVGGLLLAEFWWGSVLLVNVPAAVIGLVGAALLLPRSKRPGAPPLDFPGALLSVLGLAALVFGIIEGPRIGWSAPIIVGALLLGVAGVVGFVLWELKTDTPMVDVRVFRIKGVSGGGVAITAGMLAITGMLFLLPLYLQSVLGLTALDAGLLLLPFGITFTVVALLSSRIERRIGVRNAITAGTLVAAAGMLALSFVTETSSSGYALIVIGAIGFGGGSGLMAPPATTAILNALPTEKAGDGSAVNQVTRQVGAAMGVAIVGTVLATVYAKELAPSLSGLSSSQANTADSSINGAQQVAATQSGGGTALLDAADSAFASGYLWAMLTLALALTLSAVYVFVALRSEQRGDASEAPR